LLFTLEFEEDTKKASVDSGTVEPANNEENTVAQLQEPIDETPQPEQAPTNEISVMSANTYIKYELSEDPTTNLDNAKRFIIEYLKTEPKATAEYIITHDLCDHLRLDSKCIKDLKDLHKSVLAKAKEDEKRAKAEEVKAEKAKKEEAVKTEKARKEEEAKTEKARKEEARKSKKEEVKPKKPIVPFDIVADRVMHENFIFTMHDTREFYIYADGLFSNDGSATKVKDLARKKYKEVYVEFCIKMVCLYRHI
jgi:hypothetical protein